MKRLENVPIVRELYSHADDGCDYLIASLRNANDLHHQASGVYPAIALVLDEAEASDSDKSSIEGVWVFDDGVLHIDLNKRKSEARIIAYGASPALAEATLEKAKDYCPFDENFKPDEIPCHFWRYSTDSGPKRSRRNLDATSWDEIRGNYPHADGLEHLMTDFRPGVGGQLILWHGNAGVGKTTALRALACEWRGWCELHYIVDPDTFFGASADYMMKVLVEDSAIEDYDFEELSPSSSADKWRLIVLEDCGEMLQANAKQEVGQALSRLLNVCDGLIGRGLKFLVLVTTNEELGKLHEAVSRPGRCAAKVEFKPFTIEEANAWLNDHGLFDEVDKRKTLAELYALINGFEVQEQAGIGLGFG